MAKVDDPGGGALPFPRRYANKRPPMDGQAEITRVPRGLAGV